MKWLLFFLTHRVGVRSRIQFRTKWHSPCLWQKLGREMKKKKKKKKTSCNFNLHAKTQGKAPDNWDKRNWADAQNVRSTNSYEQDWCTLRESYQSHPSLLRNRREACRYTEELNCLHCARSPNHHTPTSWNFKLQRILLFFKKAPVSKSFWRGKFETLDASELFRYTNVTYVSENDRFSLCR